MLTIAVNVKNEKGETVCGVALAADITLTGDTRADIAAVAAEITKQTGDATS